MNAATILFLFGAFVVAGTAQAQVTFARQAPSYLPGKFAVQAPTHPVGKFAVQAPMTSPVKTPTEIQATVATPIYDPVPYTAMPFPITAPIEFPFYSAAPVPQLAQPYGLNYPYGYAPQTLPYIPHMDAGFPMLFA